MKSLIPRDRIRRRLLSLKAATCDAQIYLASGEIRSGCVNWVDLEKKRFMLAIRSHHSVSNKGEFIEQFYDYEEFAFDDLLFAQLCHQDPPTQSTSKLVKVLRRIKRAKETAILHFREQARQRQLYCRVWSIHPSSGTIVVGVCHDWIGDGDDVAEEHRLNEIHHITTNFDTMHTYVMG